MAALMTSNPAPAASAEAMSCGRNMVPASKRAPTSSSAGMSTESMRSRASRLPSRRRTTSPMGPLRPEMISCRARSSSVAGAPSPAPPAAVAGPATVATAVSVRPA